MTSQPDGDPPRPDGTPQEPRPDGTPQDGPAEQSSAGAGREVAGDDGKPVGSGLRNPARAARSVGASSLSAEALTLLLAIVPLARVGARLTGAAIALVVLLAVTCVVLVGLLRYRWAWYAALAPQVALIACGWFNGALAVLGVLFLVLWLFVLSVRRTVLRPPRRG